MVEILPEIIAVSVALLAVTGELFHLRRVAKVKRLAFGPSGRPAFWTWLTPALRTIGLAAACWGFASLWLVVEERVHNKETIAENEYKHLVLVVDISPSMHNIVDAGPNGDRSRRQRASDVLESLFNRIPMRQFKISVIAVYSDAKMMVVDSKDHEVVRHIVEKMPLWHAFSPGKTRLMQGIRQAARLAKPWRPDSAYVLMLTDGDTVPSKGMPKMPASVKDFIVVGIGDSNTGTFIADHLSRQDVSTLRQVANRLRGTYHNGNEKHLTSGMVEKFVEAQEEDTDKPWTRREWSLLAILAGSSIFAFLPMLLHYFGTNFRSGVRA